ncbi:hypothetical protein [Williamsia maris]|uniref:Uncharacterized protein n=1 Tax=Williamsia maris TaxID=72806 RepID=A0ABT1HL63_9NOCA|nr:hypothetical protein [Williamsia maris]MCP2178678.1 hypothetical protein [Williamsia maris]
MPLAESRARAAEVFHQRAAVGRTWQQIADSLGFRSIGAVQTAYKRYCESIPSPAVEEVRAEIRERKRITNSVALSSLVEAKRASDHQAVARLIDTMTRSDAELAKLYGLSSETVDVNVTQTSTAIIADARERLLAVIDGEFEPTPIKEIDR